MADPVLATLAERRKKILDGRHLDLKVEGWDDDAGLFVRYAHLPFDRLQPLYNKLQEAIENDDPQGVWDRNADILIAACKGVYTYSDDRKVGPDPARPDVWPKFDQDLADALGMAGEPPARMVCQELFDAAPFNLTAHVGALLQFCGFGNAEADKKIAGE